ncbi:MAG: hypothetical protein ACI809_000840 [Candidatus Azotimanducaceae bacterium]|jgi:hypothetical protein
MVNVRLWPRLCKNAFEQLQRSKTDQISRFYVNSKSAD